MITTVIFDMDGLMIDSEPLHQLAFDAVFQRYGKRLSEADNNAHFVGISDIDAAHRMVEMYALPITPPDLVTQKQAAYRKLIATHTVAQPGLHELLTHLKSQRYHTAIASSSMLDEIAAVIEVLHIDDFIDVFCSAQEVEKGKPAPDLFLYAAHKLGASPEQCLVLEDAPSGIRAAQAAGMQCFAIPSRETKEQDFTAATRGL